MHDTHTFRETLRIKIAEDVFGHKKHLVTFDMCKCRMVNSASSWRCNPLVAETKKNYFFGIVRGTDLMFLAVVSPS